MPPTSIPLSFSLISFNNYIYYRLFDRTDCNNGCYESIDLWKLEPRVLHRFQPKKKSPIGRVWSTVAMMTEQGVVPLSMSCTVVFLDCKWSELEGDGRLLLDPLYLSRPKRVPGQRGVHPGHRAGV